VRAAELLEGSPSRRLLPVRGVWGGRKLRRESCGDRPVPNVARSIGGIHGGDDLTRAEWAGRYSKTCRACAFWLIEGVSTSIRVSYDDRVQWGAKGRQKKKPAGEKSSVGEHCAAARVILELGHLCMQRLGAVIDTASKDHSTRTGWSPTTKVEEYLRTCSTAADVVSYVWHNQSRRRLGLGSFTMSA